VDGAHAGRQEPDTGAAVTDGRGGREATLIVGDGIGPEITQATLQVLDALGVRFDWDEQYGGMSAVEKAGTPLPDATVESIRRTGLALKGPLTTPLGGGYRSVNVALRQEFELYANVRPVKSIVPGGRYPDVDLVIIRENTEGMYIGYDRTFRVGGDSKALAQAMSVTTRDGCRRVVRYAFDYAKRHGRKKVTVVHKANILKATSGLFLETAQVIAREYAGQIASDDRIVDNAAMQLVINPAQFDVIVTTNLFGDILSDEASGLVGGLGLAPGANIGEQAAIFEAVHGSAPDIAGQGIANPSAQILAAAMMLDHVGELQAAGRLRRALETAIVKDNVRPKDLGGSASTTEFARAVARRI
jgi:isocitrate dehydrogenase (NAD+)